MSFFEEVSQPACCCASDSLAWLFSEGERASAPPTAADPALRCALTSATSASSTPQSPLPPRRSVSFDPAPPDVCLLVPDEVEFAEYCLAKLSALAGKLHEEHRGCLERLRQQLEFARFSLRERARPSPLGPVPKLASAPPAPPSEDSDSEAPAFADPDTADDLYDDDDYDDPEKEVRWYRQTRLYHRETSGEWTLQAHGELEVVEHAETQLANIEVTENCALTSLLNEPICFKSELLEGPMKGVSWVWSAPGKRPVCVEFDAPPAAREFLGVFETYRQRARKAVVLTPHVAVSQSRAQSRHIPERYALV